MSENTYSVIYSTTFGKYEKILDNEPVTSRSIYNSKVGSKLSPKIVQQEEKPKVKYKLTKETENGKIAGDVAKEAWRNVKNSNEDKPGQFLSPVTVMERFKPFKNINTDSGEDTRDAVKEAEVLNNFRDYYSGSLSNRVHLRFSQLGAGLVSGSGPLFTMLDNYEDGEISVDAMDATKADYDGAMTKARTTAVENLVGNRNV